MLVIRIGIYLVLQELHLLNQLLYRGILFSDRALQGLNMVVKLLLLIFKHDVPFAAGIVELLIGLPLPQFIIF